MSASISELEKDIEASRARLDETIDRIQDRLTTAGLVDEVLGSARRTPFHGVYDNALLAVRRNPVPVLLIAAGVGLLLKGMTPAARRARTRAVPLSSTRTVRADQGEAVPATPPVTPPADGTPGVSRAG